MNDNEMTLHKELESSIFDTIQLHKGDWISFNYEGEIKEGRVCYFNDKYQQANCVIDGHVWSIQYKDIITIFNRG